MDQHQDKQQDKTPESAGGATLTINATVNNTSGAATVDEDVLISRCVEQVLEALASLQAR
jgi:hypothetical protein